MISVIVPVYNCEKYLKDSIESLIHQSIFSQLEIIFVNDGSTDRSRTILQSYVDRYPNIKLYSQENSGVSVARNVGIQMARGDYICFFDADDIAEQELYEKLLNLVKQNHAEIAVVDYTMVFPDGVKKKHRKCDKLALTDQAAMLKEFFTGQLIYTNLIDKIFQADLAKACSFPEGYAIGEDMYFVFHALKKAKKIVVDSSESLYQYCLRSDSAMKTAFSEKHLDAVRLAEEMLVETGTCDELYHYAKVNYIHEICKMLALYLMSGSPASYEKRISPYRSELRNYSLEDAWRYMQKKYFAAFLLMRDMPQLYLLIYKARRIG